MTSVALTSALKSLVRPAVGLVREIPVHTELVRNKGNGPMAVFLPCEGRVGAALLRIYAIAEALRKLGWRTLVVPPRLTLAQRQRLLVRAGPDILVMQGARHHLNRPEFYPDIPIVYDMDDADFHLPHLARAVRNAMAQVEMVTAGSGYIADWCEQAGAPKVQVVWTGTPVSPRANVPQLNRGKVIAWAQTRPHTYQREADFVRKVARGLARHHPGLTLRLFDRQAEDDPGFAQSFAAPGLSVEWVGAAPYETYLAYFDDVALGLAPLCTDAPFSRGKSFGKVLAYLDREVPVLASDAGEHGAFFEPGLGILSNDPAVWVAEGARLLGDGTARATMAIAARTKFTTHLSTLAAAQHCDAIYRNLIRHKRDQRQSA